MNHTVDLSGDSSKLKFDHKSEYIPSPTDSGVMMDFSTGTPSSEVADSIFACGEKLPGRDAGVSLANTSKHDRHINGLTSAQKSLHNGPDELAPADSYVSCESHMPVKLRTTTGGGPLAQTPISVVTAFQQTVARFPDHPALASKVDGQWQKLTFTQYYEQVRQAAKGFIKLGLEMHRGVGIIGFNSAEWFLSDLGSIFAGGLATGIYTTNSPEACFYVADNASCNIVVVDTDTQLQKMLKVRHRLPHLRAIIQYRGELKEQYDNVYTWKQFMEIGARVSDEVLEERIRQLAPNQCCTLIYTSGTTGDPKGVMLSQDNFIWTARNAGGLARLTECAEHFVSYLPLSHVAAQILDIFVPLLYGVTVYFAQPDALKGSLGTTLKEVQPTAFLGVPRVWEKMQETMVSIGRSQWFYKRWIASWAKSVGYWGNIALMNGEEVPYGWSLANFLVFRTVRSALGFDRCRMLMTAAAPIMKDTLDFFMSLNLPLMEIYGMSESTGPHTLSLPWRYRTISAGMGIIGCATKIADPDTDGNGEVCMNGRNIFMGYLNMEEKTLETLDSDWWLRSGDVGKIDEDGYLYITGRIKELLITAGGENVSPVLIEDAVKEALPCVSNCMLIGDRRKFLAILITVKTEEDKSSMTPTDTLSPVSRNWCRSVGSSATTLSEIRSGRDERVLKAIQAGINRANESAVSRAQIIQKWSILPRDFTIHGGELGPTLKLKRSIVAKMYSDTIESFYNSPSDKKND